MPEKPKPITKFRGQYEFLSNFYVVPHPFEFRGVNWPTAEHAYQACKTRNEVYSQAIRDLPSATSAKRFGKTVPLRPDWESIKVLEMYDVLIAKFDPKYEEPWLSLQATEDRPLIEVNTWGDRFWGQCPIGVGQNWLGKLLMRVRNRG